MYGTLFISNYRILFLEYFLIQWYEHKTILKNKNQQDANYYFILLLIWFRKLDSSSLTKTKNWRGRNEVIETSVRLHPLWPQNKWLHTPRTMDYRHTRQARWIQTELAFILSKNATKTNPIEIIPLQTTRKENNWKTEEALARAAVTVGTEQKKGSNSWCLWWWCTSYSLNMFRALLCPSSEARDYNVVYHNDRLVLGLL